jgi:heme/copper-type cytochrome/quinol oxidase subunit 3
LPCGNICPPFLHYTLCDANKTNARRKTYHKNKSIKHAPYIMKNFLSFAALFVFLFAAFTSCNSDKTNMGSAAADVQKQNLNMQTRASLKKAATFSAALSSVDMTTVQQIAVAKKQQNQAADAALMNNIFNQLQAAENKAQALTSVKFTISDAPVEDGIFLFALESQVDQSLSFEMFDQEGYQMAANNTLSLSAGNNYKAINVKDINNGEYVVRVKDGENRELVQRVTINNN